MTPWSVYTASTYSPLTFRAIVPCDQPLSCLMMYLWDLNYLLPFTFFFFFSGLSLPVLSLPVCLPFSVYRREEEREETLLRAAAGYLASG